MPREGSLLEGKAGMCFKSQWAAAKDKHGARHLCCCQGSVTPASGWQRLHKGWFLTPDGPGGDMTAGYLQQLTAGGSEGYSFGQFLAEPRALGGPLLRVGGVSGSSSLRSLFVVSD